MAEQAAGESWDVLMRRELFQPLHMDGCGFGWPPPGQPRGHRWQGGRFAVHDLSDGYRMAAYIAPAADIHCAVEDMLAFGRAHMTGDPILAPATWAKLHDAPVDGYALGWFVTGFGYHHLGSAETFTASLVVSPKRDLVVFMATNAAGFPGQGELVSQVATRAFADFAKAP
jgi:CubicO group peptidase (beta-lactamase class C family)